VNDVLLAVRAELLAAGDTDGVKRLDAMTPAELKELAGDDPDPETDAPALPPTRAGPAAFVHVNDAPASPDVALAGADGAALARLMRQAVEAGVKLMAGTLRDAVSRYAGVGPLLDRTHVATLAESYATTRATAELLGRSRVREKATRAGDATFADADSLTTFADGPGVLGTPEAAVAYFTGLVPELGIDPRRFAGEQRRRAFTLAASTNRVLTGRVQAAIAAGLKQNRSTADVTADITRLMDAAGVSHRNPQYAEMVFRTNANDCFQTGLWEEAQAPDVADLFPVWEYLGIDDHRAGKDHRPHFGLYYPRRATFADVRGPRPFNCRCSLRWVDSFEWDDLRAAGKRVELWAA
jgi:hypothetical protein